MALGEWADASRVAAWERGGGQDAGCPCCGEFDYAEERAGSFHMVGGAVLREVEWRCNRSGRTWTDAERFEYAGSALSE